MASRYFSDKVVWLTGASSGIGEALAYELSQKGAKLILSSRRKEALEKVKGNCPAEAQPNIRILPLDLAKPSTLSLSVEAALQLFGRVDILINNGGISQRSLTKETTLEVDRHLMEVDYFGTVALTKYLLPHFLQRKSGHVVTVSSVMGKIGTPYRSGYAAAKHALHGFFDSLRAELWRESKNIHVTLVCPGWIRTNITLNALTGDGSALNKMDTTTDRGMKPDVFAKKMVRAIEKKKEEVYIGGAKEKFAVVVKRYFPKVFSRIIRTAKVR
ncbi:MAG: SDR family oxidoreductase [Flammeovirgaceae bacterium]|nr:MAG: SDR family oxidoreductase [Flammeovirgaceae bacterium]